MIAMKRLAVLSSCLVLGVTLTACKKAPTTEPEQAHHGDGYHGSEGHHGGGEQHQDFEGREVVDNWRAELGDVTVCPISGKKFEVDANSGHFSYQGYTFVFCCSGGCLEKVEANPGKYLDRLVEEAGGPASDPDPNEGGAIDDRK
jgi:YHS domain-containing protein